MTTDLPDDWFRPATEPGDGDAAAPPSGPRHAESPVEVSQPEPTPLPRPTPEPVRPASEAETSGSLPVVTDEEPSRQPWLWRHAGVVTALTLVLALAVGLGMGSLVSRRTVEPTVAPTTPPTSVAPTATAVQPWTGPVAALAASQVTASCVAPSIRDQQGKVVNFGAEHVLDPSTSSVWRCNGTGVGETLTFSFAEGAELAGVGIINGDVTAKATYMSSRRITSVTWTLPTGEHFTQNLSENSPSSQQVLIPPMVITGPLTLTITASTPAPTGEPTDIDAVVISQVTFLTPKR